MCGNINESYRVANVTAYLNKRRAAWGRVRFMRWRSRGRHVKSIKQTDKLFVFQFMITFSIDPDARGRPLGAGLWLLSPSTVPRPSPRVVFSKRFGFTRSRFAFWEAMSLPNLAYVIPAEPDESKLLSSSITDRMRELQKILQYIPPGKTPGVPRSNSSSESPPQKSSASKASFSRDRRKFSLSMPLLGRRTGGLFSAAISRTTTAISRTTDSGSQTPSPPSSDPPPACSGVLFLQNSQGHWKKRWCRYSGRRLCLCHDEKGPVQEVIDVSFCMREIAQGESKNDDLYWCYLESQQAYFCFKVYSPSHVFEFRAESGEVCDSFVNMMRGDLRSSLSADVWQQKMDAAREMSPLCREQFIIQMTNHQVLISSLSQSGFLQQYLPIMSQHKEKSGVLSMETEGGWREYYFVLFEGTLYYYQDSKSTTPAGFITLRYATVQLDSQSLSEGSFVFHIKTPLRVVHCRARHSVALSEWVASLEAVISCEKSPVKEKKKRSAEHRRRLLQNRRSSHDILGDINKMLVNIDTLEALLKNRAATEVFSKWLEVEAAPGGARRLAFYLDNEKLKMLNDKCVNGISPDRFVSTVDRMHYKYLSESAPVEWRLEKVDRDIVDEVEMDMRRPTRTIFAKVEGAVYPALRGDFDAFKESDEFAALSKRLSSKTVMDERKVPEFCGDGVQTFVLRAKGAKKSHEIKFNRRQNVITIGRDKSNDVVIEDSRVSRSHARVEYNNTQCEYIDLGSSCGSKLNGRPVLRARLKPGDIVEIGLSVLIFNVRKRRRSSILQRFGIKS